MKRLLEWKQRMLQSPLTRKSGNSVVSGGSGARSSERSTPTLADRDAPSPRIRIESPIQPQPSKSLLPCFRNSTLACSLFLSLSLCRTVHPLGALNIPARFLESVFFIIYFPSCLGKILGKEKEKKTNDDRKSSLAFLLPRSFRLTKIPFPPNRKKKEYLTKSLFFPSGSKHPPMDCG